VIAHFDTAIYEISINLFKFIHLHKIYNQPNQRTKQSSVPNLKLFISTPLFFPACFIVGFIFKVDIEIGGNINFGD